MKTITFSFEDNGQDFLWWKVEELPGGIGKVIDCGPFQQSIWADGSLHINLLVRHEQGDHLVCTRDIKRSLKTGESFTLKHAIKSVEVLDDHASH